jgi:hypothetical protein
MKTAADVKKRISDFARALFGPDEQALAAQREQEIWDRQRALLDRILKGEHTPTDTLLDALTRSIRDSAQREIDAARKARKRAEAVEASRHARSNRREWIAAATALALSSLAVPITFVVLWSLD